MNTTIQLSNKTKSKLELLKNDDDTFEDVIKKLLPEGVSEDLGDSTIEPPAFRVYCEDCDIDSSLWEEDVSWRQLREDPVGTVYCADCKSGYSEDEEGSATIVFKDYEGVVILFKKTEYHTHHNWSNSPKYGVVETTEWLERFTFL